MNDEQKAIKFMLLQKPFEYRKQKTPWLEILILILVILVILWLNSFG